MSIQHYRKLAQHTFRLLKVNEITFSIGRTNKGNLGIVFRESSDDFDLMLDSVPLSTKSMLEDEYNIELKKMVEKYWFDQERTILSLGTITNKETGHETDMAIKLQEVPYEPTKLTKKKGGRPKGSKNKTHGNTKTEKVS